MGSYPGAAKFNGERFESIENLKDTSVHGIIQDFQGYIWFACDGSMVRFNPAAADWQSFTQNDGLPSYSYYTAAIDADGWLYFGSDNGLVQYADDTFSTWTVPDVPVFGDFGRILLAPDGYGLWFVEKDGGPNVDRLDLGDETWSMVEDLPGECNPLAVDLTGTIGCGGYDGLWLIYTDGSQVHLTTEQGLPSNQVSTVVFPADSEGEVWVGTADKGIAHLAEQKIVRVFNTQDPGLTSDSIYALFVPTDGSVWVGTDRGLDHFQNNGEWAHYTIGNPFTDSFEFITDLAEDTSGAIWVSAQGEGALVRRFFEGSWTQYADGEPGVLFPQDYIQTITAGSDGSLWFGSYFHGAARFDGETWSLFGIQDGLIHPNVLDIYIDDNGAVWFATSGGVTRYTP